jgi:hypothetical protein
LTLTQHDADVCEEELDRDGEWELAPPPPPSAAPPSPVSSQSAPGRPPVSKLRVEDSLFKRAEEKRHRLESARLRKERQEVRPLFHHPETL